jgi:hypothetical protein
MTAPSFWRRVRNTLNHSRRKRMATIDLAPDGFLLTFRKRERRMRWADIDRIDAGIRDYFSFDGLYVVLFTAKTKLEIDELDDGFQPFENALFERWPQIRDDWNKLLIGNPREPQHATLWRRGA